MPPSTTSARSRWRRLGAPGRAVVAAERSRPFHDMGRPLYRLGGQAQNYGRNGPQRRSVVVVRGRSAGGRPMVSTMDSVPMRSAVARRREERAMIERPGVLVFDVNETLLDIESLTPHFERVFGDPAVLREWFGQLVLYSMTATLSRRYVDFFTLGAGVLG